MGIYVFRTRTLIRALMQDAKSAKSSHDFGKDVIPRLIQEFRVFAYPYEGYWEDIGTIDAYWKSNMAFLSSEPPFDLHDPAWPVRTYQRQSPPAFIDRTTVQASIISAGCRLRRADVRTSVLSPGVIIEDEALVQDSIVFNDARIGRGARLTKVIVDKKAIIPDGFVVGEDAEADARQFRIYGDGIRIVPKGWRLS
jgi:glucose-1-phosphate adenylyltransferase